MSIKKSLVLLAVACLAAASFAQGGGQGRGMRGFGGGSPTALLQRDDVKEELKLTDDQKTKLGDIQSGMREEIQAAMQEAGGDRSQMQKIFAKVQAGITKKINAVLTEEQQKRLKEIFIQDAGNSAITNEDVQKDLKLTEEQIKKIKDLQKKQQEANTSIFSKMQNGEIERDQVQELMQKNQKAMGDELGKLLTDDQKAKMKELSGKPFKKKDDGR